MFSPTSIKTGLPAISRRGILISFLFIFSFLNGTFVHAQKGEIKISGVVIDYITSMPVPGVEVIVSARKLDLGYKEPEEKVLKNYFSDSLGRYYPDPFNRRIAYEVSFRKDGYSSKQICFNLSSAPASFDNETSIEFGTNIYLLPLHPDVNYEPVRKKDYGLFYYNSKLKEWMWDEDITNEFREAEDSVIKELDSLNKAKPELTYRGTDRQFGERTMYQVEKICKPVNHPILEWTLKYFYVVLFFLAFMIYFLIRWTGKRRNKKSIN